MRVGFIGLGRMGQVMARRILDAGFELILFNRTPEKTQDLAARGAKVAKSLGDLAVQSDVVVSMLANDAALDDVVYQADALLASLPAGRIHVAMGTHGVMTIKKLDKAHRGKGQVLVSAPVLGRPEAVMAGKMAIVAAGPEAAITTCGRLFDALGRRTFAAGSDPAMAASIKIANNLLLACAIEALGEAFSLTQGYGVTNDIFYDVVTDGLFASPAYTNYGKIIARGAYDSVGFDAILGLKDVNLALSAGEAARIPLPSANVVRDRLLGAIAHGDGDKDWAVMAQEQARSCGK